MHGRHVVCCYIWVKIKQYLSNCNALTGPKGMDNPDILQDYQIICDNHDIPHDYESFGRRI